MALGFTFGAAGAQACTTSNVTPNGAAIGGWDTVAYFTESRGIEGKPEFSHEWAGASWLFASQEYLDLFAADPEAYAP